MNTETRGQWLIRQQRLSYLAEREAETLPSVRGHTIKKHSGLRIISTKPKSEMQKRKEEMERSILVSPVQRDPKKQVGGIDI